MDILIGREHRIFNRLLVYFTINHCRLVWGCVCTTVERLSAMLQKKIYAHLAQMHRHLQVSSEAQIAHAHLHPQVSSEAQIAHTNRHLKVSSKAQIAHANPHPQVSSEVILIGFQKQ